MRISHVVFLENLEIIDFWVMEEILKHISVIWVAEIVFWVGGVSPLCLSLKPITCINVDCICEKLD